jgi:uncharacterized membrane protein
MRMTGLGQILFALSFAAIGALSIGFHDFAPAWELLPKWLAGHPAVVVASGAVLLVGGLALLVPPAARMSALVLTAVLVLRFLLLHLPRMISHPQIEVVWESMSENLIYIAGAWTIFSMLPGEDRMLARLGNVRLGQIILALATPAIGLSHIIYLDNTAPLIPSWILFHVPLAYITGAAWIAGGAGILFGVLPRLAATLLAVMVSLFTLLVWVPMLIATPSSIPDWSEMCTSVAISGAAWAVAESYRSRSWGLSRSG